MCRDVTCWISNGLKLWIIRKLKNTTQFNSKGLTTNSDGNKILSRDSYVFFI